MSGDLQPYERQLIEQMDAAPVVRERRAAGGLVYVLGFLSGFTAAGLLMLALLALVMQWT